MKADALSATGQAKRRASATVGGEQKKPATGWRHWTGAERRNWRMHRIFDAWRAREAEKAERMTADCQ